MQKKSKDQSSPAHIYFRIQGRQSESDRAVVVVGVIEVGRYFLLITVVIMTSNSDCSNSDCNNSDGSKNDSSNSDSSYSDGINLQQ